MNVSPLTRAVLVTAAGAVAASSLAAPAHAAAPTWKVVKTYDNGEYDSLNGTLALSRKDAWVFGGGDRKKGDFNRPLAYHWNGKKWASSSLPAGLTGHLWDGSATSSTNVWAYGGNSEAGGAQGAYVLRWNGKKWAVVKKFGEEDGRITGILALSPTNVWVFGAPGADKGVGTWHYNGRKWTELKNPPSLIGRAEAASAKDVWGWARTLDGTSSTLVRFDGKRWRNVSIPKGVLPAGKRASVGLPEVRSGKEVWVPVSVERSATQFLLRWDGKRWRKYSVPGRQGLDGVLADGRGGAWSTTWLSNNATWVRHVSASGKWTTVKVTGPRGKVSQVRDMTLMPGTRSVVGAGELFPANRSSSDGAIFYFKG